MKNVYIGKISKTGKGIAICLVIDSDIATGNATVYNRETDQIETVTLAEKHTLFQGIKRLAEDTESEYEEKVKKALEKTLNMVCGQYESNCSKCPRQKECEKYSHIYQITN